MTTPIDPRHEPCSCCGREEEPMTDLRTGERRAAMSELIWEVASAYDWRVRVVDQVELAGALARAKHVTPLVVRAAAQTLALDLPRGVLTALVEAVRTYDRRRLNR